jgi:hypothetical protein
MANKSNSEQTNAIRPTSYVVEKVHLFTNLNSEEQFVDLTFVSQDIVITESIFTMGISLDVTIGDATGLLEGYKIMGNEKVLVQISRSDIESGEKKEYELHLRIANIGPYSRMKDSLQTFTLTCVSDYVYHNNLMTLTNPFEGSIGTSIENICKTQLKIDKDDLEINSETGLANGVYPRLKPLSAIKWLLLNATEGKTPFFFYQRVADNKVVLESYKNMVDKDSFETYEYAPYFQSDITTGKDLKEGYIEERKKITALSSDLDISQLKLIADGAYGSTLHTLDIANKTYNTVKYNYNRTEKLNDNDSLSDNMKLLDKPIKEFTEGKNLFISKNSLAFNDQKGYSDLIGPGYLDAQSYIKNLNTLTLDIMIAGDFNLKLGDKITTNINRAGSDSNEPAFDQYLSGNYIITKIIHKFSTKYTMKLTIQKDSFSESIDDIIQIQNRPEVV